jgi:malonyl-CoA/methylmalonyl-CoA synthetase
VRAHLFASIADRVADGARPFLETPSGRRITYDGVVAGSGRLAHALRAGGVEPGDRVAAQVEKSPEAILLYLATVRAGAVFLPLNTAYTVAELDYFLADAEPALVVCDPARAAEVRALAAARGVRAVETLGADGRGTLTDRARPLAASFSDAERGPEDLAALLYTSGTTGRSKGAMLTHENLASNARTLVDLWRFGPGDVLLHALPIFHTHGLFTAATTTLFAGGSLLFLPRFDPDEVVRLLPRATSMMGVPTFYVRLLQHPGVTREATRHVRLFTSGSAPLLPETHRAWQERTGHAILERYGMTETNMTTSNPYDGERVAGTVGSPLPGVELRIVDPVTGRPLAMGEIGMIEVRGPNVFKGYWRNPEKTRAELHADGFFVTGDLGTVDRRGHVTIVGRGKDLIITGGLNVYPREVEAELDAIPGVAESAVVGLPHPDLGEGVTAFVVLEPGRSLAEADVVRALEGRLARFKHPRRVVAVDALPRNAMGKVQKGVLREAHAGLYARRAEADSAVPTD